MQFQKDFGLTNLVLRKTVVEENASARQRLELSLEANLF